LKNVASFLPSRAPATYRRPLNRVVRMLFTGSPTLIRKRASSHCGYSLFMSINLESVCAAMWYAIDTARRFYALAHFLLIRVVRIAYFQGIICASMGAHLVSSRVLSLCTYRTLRECYLVRTRRCACYLCCRAHTH
jgi:hypothetical protein